MIGDLSLEALLITGDISEGDDVVFELNRLADAFGGDIFFVLGNHDFYGDGVANVRREVVSVARQSATLTYLTDAGPVPLSPETWLVGEDGWGDGTVGDAVGTLVRLHDFAQIDDFKGLSTESRNRILKAQGGESADRLRQKLFSLPRDAGEVVVATHVPPFREACWYQGRTADDQWAPYFVCGQVGEVLKAFTCDRPDTKVTVLCGHTHHAGTATLRENLVVHTGAARYEHPEIVGILNAAESPLVLLSE